MGRKESNQAKGSTECLDPNCFDTDSDPEILGAQWLSGRMLESRPKGCGFEPHCIVQ